MNFIFERKCLFFLSKVIYIECILLIFLLFLYIFRFLYLKKKVFFYGDFLYEFYLCYCYDFKKLLVLLIGKMVCFLFVFFWLGFFSLLFVFLELIFFFIEL